MKRIAALAGIITLAMLGVPTAAMAAPSGGGPGSGIFWCSHHHHPRCTPTGPVGSPRPPSCTSGTITFDLASKSSAISEDLGPAVFVGEGVDYNGKAYTVASTTPGGGLATLDQANGHLWVNGGPAIVGGTASAWCIGG